AGPVGQAAGQGGVGELAALPDGVVGVLDGQRVQGGVAVVQGGGVQLAEVAGQYPHRPAVGDDVVHGDQQHVLIAGEAGEQDPEQGAVAQVEGPRVLGGEQLIQGSGCAGEVGGPDRGGGGGADDLDALAVQVTERGPQRLMAGHQGLECAGQRCRV